MVFAFLAGLLTALSPCVLPVLPFVTGSSLSKNAKGPAALALGLLLAFVTVTLTLSRLGHVFGLEASTLRIVSGIILAASGLLFISEKIQNSVSEFVSRLVSPLSQSKNFEGTSLASQFLSGILLGVVWTPCSGPSLGTALGLATEAASFQQALALLLVFGMGATIPLLVIAYGGRAIFKAIRERSALITTVKKVLGLLIIVFGILIATSLDRKLEAIVTNLLPDSWLEFVTKF